LNKASWHNRNDILKGERTFLFAFSIGEWALSWTKALMEILRMEMVFSTGTGKVDGKK